MLVKITEKILIFIKLLIGYLLLNIFYRKLYKENIWLICEKRDEARDNGYHFFKYLKENHTDINAYYVITKDSTDYDKVKKYGDIIYANTFKHCIYYLAAKYSISSQAYGAFPYNLNLKELRVIKRLRNKNQKTIFLQHGIIKDKMSNQAFDADGCDTDLFVCSAQREVDFIREQHGYTKKSAQCLGLCRFDKLYNNKNIKTNTILLMPTWRMWLSRLDDKVFLDSDYYNAYFNLLNDARLKSILKEFNYKLIFYPHYEIQKRIDKFKDIQTENIIIADKNNYDVQDLLINTDIMITDYSSVFFDFAYMEKPLIYYQFDEEKFYGSHYDKGYFDYRRDGFGPVVCNSNDLLDELENIIKEKDFDLYYRRSKEFFTLRDNQNCNRTFNAIRQLDEMR